MAILEIKHVEKRFKDVHALCDISISFEKGIYGLIGANGAGKSTLFQILTTSMNPTSGEILYQNEPISKNAALYRSKIGYMPQNHKAYDHLSALQFLYYMASLKGMKKQAAKQEIQQLAQSVHLLDELPRKIGTYSGGMRQRLMFIQALLGDPEILLLDEPTAGLDPYERISMRNHIFHIAKDKTVIIATHVMQDIEFIANELILLKKGKILRQESGASLLEQLQGHVHEVIVDEQALETFQKQEKIARMVKTKEGIRVRYISKEKKEGYVNADLEDVYLHFMIE